MTDMKYLLIGTYLLLSTLSLSAQLLVDESRQRVREGNQFYESGQFVEAEVSYRKAENAKAGQEKGAFNLGNALYQQGRFQEAAGQFARAASLTEDRLTQAEAYHNLGNAHLKQAQQVQAKEDPGQALQQSIEAYKQALRRNPSDEETRYNLAYAMQLLKQEQQQNQQKQDQDKDQQGDQDQNKDQDSDQQKDQDQQDQDQENDQEKQKQDQPTDEDKEAKKEAREQQMSPQEIEQMLEALRYQEQKLREDMQRQQTKAKQGKVEKDW
jgi:tetratricopeptide (TPR) repeat protein